MHTIETRGYTTAKKKKRAEHAAIVGEGDVERLSGLPRCLGAYAHEGQTVTGECYQDLLKLLRVR